MRIILFPCNGLRRVSPCVAQQVYATGKEIAMRILFTTTGGTGHFHPLVPLAHAAAAAGHAVACAASYSLRPAVEAAGLRFFPAGFDRRGVPLDDLFPAMRSLTGPALRQFVGVEIRVNIEARQMAPDLLRIADEWTPDLIVRDTAEYGGCVTAEALGIPHASVRTAYGDSSYGQRHVVVDALNALRADHGLPPDPDGISPFRYLHLAFEPPGFWPADEPLAPTYHLLRPVVFDRSGGEGLPPWVASLPPVPTVCATLGTFMNRSTAVFAAILEGLRDEPVNLIVAVGRDIDPAQFGPQPQNVHIERYIPVSLLLPHCVLVVHQAGFSTVVTTLLHGLPMVTIPLGADQPQNARSCAALGVGEVIGPEERTAGAIREAARRVLREPLYRERAERVRDEMAALPGPEHAVKLLERLALEKQPLLTA